MKSRMLLGCALVTLLASVASTPLSYERLGDALPTNEPVLLFDYHTVTIKDIEEMDAAGLDDFMEKLKVDLKRVIIHGRNMTAEDFSRRMRMPFFNSFIQTLKDLVDKVKMTFTTGVTTRETCAVCKVTVYALKWAAWLISTDDVGRLLQLICELFNENIKPICIGLPNQYKSELWFIMKNSKTSDQEMCSVMFGDTCGSVKHENHQWSVSLPGGKPPVDSSEQSSYPKIPLNILHISDTHVDPEYVVGSNADCGTFLCCQEGSGKPASPDKAAQRWGDYRSCDLPEDTLDNMMANIARNHKVNFAYWTGDLPPHDLWKVTKQSNGENFHLTTNIITKHLPTTTVYPVVGNHEAVPPNLFPLLDADTQYSSKSRWLYEELADAWKVWLPESALESVRRGGYYSVKPIQGLRVISLNTNFCYQMNFWLTVYSRDPGDQMKWLISELTDAEKNNEKVHIIGHIPPGISDCVQVWSRNFHSIVNRFESTITGQFYGHTHNDEFTVFYDSQERDRAVGVAYIAPSVTTYTGNNPAYRIYNADGSSMKVVSSSTYFMNLTEANLLGQPRWRKEYDTRTSYNLKNSSPEEWDKLVKRMKTDDHLFEMFYSYHSRLSDVKKECDKSCKNLHLCNMRKDRSHDYAKCDPIGV